MSRSVRTYRDDLDLQTIEVRGVDTFAEAAAYARPELTGSFPPGTVYDQTEYTVDGVRVHQFTEVPQPQKEN
jgi:hypothetical protein